MPTLICRAAHRPLALVAAALLAACHDPMAAVDRPNLSTGGGANPAQVGATVAWNQVARDLVAKHSTSAPASIRTFALLSVAQYNAIVTANKATGCAPHASTAGAVAGASAAALSYAYPQEADSLEALVRRQSASPRAPGGAPESFAAGEAIGRSVAAGLVDRARTDRYFAQFSGAVPLCPGCWRADAAPPAFATLGQAKAYLLTANDQFRPPPPPAYGSPAFLAALAEVRQIADTRTAAQDSIAKFWALPGGTVGAQGYWNRIASELAGRYRLDDRKAAHTLALLNVAAYDAIVASHEAKYHYWLIRPSQADPQIVRAIGLPSFPAYPSNHSAFAGAAAAVLGAAFPSERARLDAHAAEGALSRVYGGIHYRFDIEAGLTLGRRVGAWTLAHDVTGHRPFVFR